MNQTTLKIFVFCATMMTFTHPKFAYNRGIYDNNNLEKQDTSTLDLSKIRQIVRYANGTKDYTKTYLNSINAYTGDPFLEGISKVSGYPNYAVRGYAPSDYEVVYDGIVLNGFENATYHFPNWVALTNLSSAAAVGFETDCNKSIFGGKYGTYALTSSQLNRKMTSFSWISGNHLYRNRFHIVHNTDEMKNGWSVAVSASGAWAEEAYVEGTAHSEWSYLLMAKKIINQRHALSFTVMGALVTGSQSDYAPEEVFRLRNDNYYSPTFGYQDGKIRQANQFTSHVPVGIAHHNWKISKSAEVSSSMAYSKGKSAHTMLEWKDAGNPSPVYFLNMPHYWDYMHNEAVAEHLRDEWAKDTEIYQINWQHLQEVNSHNLYQINNANGIQGNNITGNLSKYYMAVNNRDNTDFHLTSTLSHQLNSRLKLTAGLYYQNSRQHYYKTMDDLLGSDFHIDTHYNSDFSAFQNEMYHPFSVVFEGDHFAYDYIAHKKALFIHALIAFELPRLVLTGYGSIGIRSTMRKGVLTYETEHGFPSASAVSVASGNYNFRGEAKYRIHQNHNIQLNGFTTSTSPDFDDLFIQPRFLNLKGNNANQTAKGISLGYKANTARLKISFNAFRTAVAYQNKSLPYYDEVSNNRGIVSLKGLNQVHEGVELGLDYTLSKHFSLNLAAAHGKYFYDSRPDVSIYYDHFSDPFQAGEKAYVKDFRVPNFPGTVLGIGVAFQSENNIFFEIRGNYCDNIFSAFAFESRTESSVSGLHLPENELSEFLKQRKLAGGATLDVSLGKAWSVFKKQHTLLLSIFVSNALDNQDIATGGAEPGGFSASNLLIVQHKLMYLYGRNVFVNLSYQF